MTDKIVAPIPLRRCSKCQRNFPATIEFFYRCKGGKYGLAACCIECRSGSPSRKRQCLPVGQKRCATCTLVKSVTEFHRCESNADGLQYRCKTCVKRIRTDNHAERRQKELLSERAYRAKNGERLREKDSRRRRLYPESGNIHVQKRRSRRYQLPHTLSANDWKRALDYFEGCCAICGRPAGLWHTLAKEHWIALADPRPDNPGTVAKNIIPMCHSLKGGEGGCNNSKSGKDPLAWLYERFGKRKAQQLLARIHRYFDSLT